MPSTSKKQHNLMAMVANNPAAAKRTGVPQSVGQEFMKADKGLKFGKGTSGRADLQKINRPKTDQGKSELFAKGGDMKESKAMLGKELAFMKKKGAPKSMIKHEMGEAGMKKMASGGMAMVMKDGKKVPAFAADGQGKMKHGGAAKKMNMGGMGYAKGGGIESKGKTKGKMITMKMGGKSC
jgi:hypothetical protein